MITSTRAKRLPSALVWAACLGGATFGCDEGPEQPSEALAADLDADGAPPVADSARDVRGHDEAEHDGCFGAERLPIAVEWVTAGNGSPEVEVDLDGEFAAGDRVELQFYVIALPAGPRSQRLAGEPVPVRGDGRVQVPEAVIAAVRSGGAHVVYAVLTGCRADDPHGNCERRNTGELHIEDGRVFRPEEYQAHLREKWSATRPWLFDDGVVTGVIDMKGR